MSPSDLVLAAVLLTAPPMAKEVSPAPEHWPGIKAAVHQTAIEWEIMDEREKSYIFAKEDEFEGDLQILRRRYQDLKNAPRLTDAFRLPERKQACEAVRFNRSYRDHLNIRSNIEFDRADDFLEALRETDRLYQVWDAVRDARCEFLYVPARRHALSKLKNLIGEEAYQTGQLPPNVPTWRFNEMK